MHKIFVYGTLRKGGKLHSNLYGCKCLGTGRIPGVLLALGWFPGLLDGTGSVLGEVYEINPTLLQTLDRVEGVHAGLYERRPVKVTLSDKSVIDAEAYYFCEDPLYYSKGVVPDGDWMAYIGESHMEEDDAL